MGKAVRDYRTWHWRAAIILVVIAVVFWLWFGIGSAFVTQGTALDWFMYLMMPGLKVPWHWFLSSVPMSSGIMSRQLSF